MRRLSGSAVARHQVFVLADGSFVVQWDDNQVQDVLTGQYYEFEHLNDFGHAITDHELVQLKAAGRVEHYSRQYVWLYALPETGRFGVVREMGRGDRVRMYYLSTALPKSQVDAVAALLKAFNYDKAFRARTRSGIVVILDANGNPFISLQDAEAAYTTLAQRKTDLLNNMAIAFVEVDARATPRNFVPSDDVPLNLDDLIASQADTSITVGRRVMITVSRADEQQAFDDLLTDMQIDVQHAVSARETLRRLEDEFVDLLIMDFVLADMHGWQLIRSIREIDHLRDLPLLIITDEHNLGMSIARVEYLTRPVSIARLRHNVWKTIRDTTREHRPSH